MDFLWTFLTKKNFKQIILLQFFLFQLSLFENNNNSNKQQQQQKQKTTKQKQQQQQQQQHFFRMIFKENIVNKLAKRISSTFEL